MAYGTRRTAEKEDKLQAFTAHFYGDSVTLGNHTFPIGQISTEILNLPENLFYDLYSKSNAAINEINRLFDLGIKKDSAFLFAVQKRLNEIFDILFTLPPYRYMKIDKETPRSLLLIAYREHRGEFDRSVMPGTSENEILREFFENILSTGDELSVFYNYISTMLDIYFEGLKKRDAEHYAVGVYKFMSDSFLTDKLSKMFPPLDRFQFRQSRDMSMEYVPMPSPLDKKVYCLAERMEFTRLTDFLHVDLFRGLTRGNTPRRCHNCGKLFLLLTGHDTCYCNNIAPDRPDRTCRDVGAHNKEAKKARTPVQQEYQKAYNRLKTRKSRGKISIAEWNAEVAKAMDIRDIAERGELDDAEMKRRFNMI